MTTEKLYWSDPTRSSFETHGAILSRLGDRPSIVLPATCFYPEGGGQLGDTGTIAFGGVTVRVVDTQIDDGGTIHHLVDQLPTAFDAGAVVKGTIDEARRRDHTVQHTAQHALSRALADEARAETVSARLGATSCTIDVSRPSLPDGDLLRAEDLVNDVIVRDLVVRTLFPTAEELEAMPLRKRPKVDSGVRVVEIDGFDITPCGGTHVTRTGQIGQVRVVGVEKYKGMVRITFHAGKRALADARARHGALAAAAAELTCGPLDVPAGIAKLRAELKTQRALLEATRAELVEHVAKKLLGALPAARDASTPIVLPVMRTNDDVTMLRVLAGKLTEADARVVALCGSPDPQSGELVLVVQRGPAGKLDCGAFVLAQAKARSGRGGGRSERAEGRFPRGTSLEVLAAAAEADARKTPST